VLPYQNLESFTHGLAGVSALRDMSYALSKLRNRRQFWEGIIRQIDRRKSALNTKSTDFSVLFNSGCGENRQNLKPFGGGFAVLVSDDC
jgi:hypothetical protein